MKKVFVLIIGIFVVNISYCITQEEGEKILKSFYEKLSVYAIAPRNIELSDDIKKMVSHNSSFYSDINTFIEKKSETNLDISTYLAMIENKGHVKYGFRYNISNVNYVRNDESLVLYYLLTITCSGAEYSNMKYEYFAEISIKNYKIESVKKTKERKFNVPTKLSIKPISINLDEYGGTKTIIINSNKKWEIKNSYSYVKLSKNSNEVLIEVDINNNYDDRIIRIPVTSEEVVQYITIYQKGKPKPDETTLSINPTSLYFLQTGGTKSVYVTSNKYWYVSRQPYSGTTRKDGNYLYVTIPENTGTLYHSDSFEITAGEKKIRVDIGQPAKTIPTKQKSSWWTNSNDFPIIYIEASYGLGIGMSDKKDKPLGHYVGGNFAVIPHAFGFQGSFLYEVNNDHNIIATLSPMFTLTNALWSNADVQLWAGAGIAREKNDWGKKKIFPAFDFGLRIGWDIAFEDVRDEHRFGFWSLSFGAKYFNKEIIPTIGMSLMPVGAFVDGADYFWDEPLYDLPHYYMEANIGAAIGDGTTDLMVGLTNSWQRYNTGVYVTGQFGVLNHSWSVVAGPTFRLTPSHSKFDCSLYGGVGYGVFEGSRDSHNGVAGDLGIRFGWAHNGYRFGLWSVSVGCQKLTGAWEPYLGINIVLGAPAAALGLGIWGLTMIKPNDNSTPYYYYY